MIDLIKLTVTAVGEDESASGFALSDQIARGRVLAIFIDSDPAAFESTTIEISDLGDPVSETILGIPEITTDLKFYPRRDVQSEVGANLTYDGTWPVFEPYIVCGQIQASVSLANNNQVTTFYIWIENLAADLDFLTFRIGPTVGANGAAAAEYYGPAINGEILAVHVDYEGGHPNTTDFYLLDKDDPAAENLFSKTNNNANLKVYPRRTMHTNLGAVINYNVGGTAVAVVKPPFVGRLFANIAQSNPGLYITATVWFERKPLYDFSRHTWPPG